MSAKIKCDCCWAAFEIFRNLNFELISYTAMDTYIYKSLRQDITCPFLCERELIKDPVVLQNCGHIFCFECVKAWLKSRKRTCPICRKKITESVVDADTALMSNVSILQPNPRLKTIYGLIEILLGKIVLKRTAYVLFY